MEYCMLYSLKKVAGVAFTIGWALATCGPDGYGANAKDNYATPELTGFSKPLPTSMVNNSVKQPYWSGKKMWPGTHQASNTLTRALSHNPSKATFWKGGKKRSSRSPKKLFFPGKAGMAERYANAPIARVGFSEPVISSSRKQRFKRKSP